MRSIRKTLLVSTAVALAASSAQTGGYVEPVVEPVIAPEVIVEDTSSTAAGIIVPLMVLALVAVAIASRGSGAPAMSDARVKTDILRVGATATGLPLYHFRYIGDPRVWEGVMAQDVLETRPDAVVQGPQGVLMVDYARLGIEMRQVH